MQCFTASVVEEAGPTQSSMGRKSFSVSIFREKTSNRREKATAQLRGNMQKMHLFFRDVPNHEIQSCFSLTAFGPAPKLRLFITWAYFVTICTQDRVCLFDVIKDGAIQLNDAGRMVEK